MECGFLTSGNFDVKYTTHCCSLKGIMVTAKKRQEFRIKLQKRARRRAEKKIELLEEDKSLKEVSISIKNLKPQTHKIKKKTL